MNALVDQQMMARAVKLARQGWYSTSPNPRVGCVLFRDGQVLGEAAHLEAGKGHAEVNALAGVDDAAGATAYVTLEPCSHHGKTPPCAQALVQAGVSRVVFGMTDPNPLVAGRGIDHLRAAGIQVDGPVLEQACLDLNPGFIKRMTIGLPRVYAKLASSLDGRTAMATGESQWITGPAARQDVQRLRASSCALVTGVGTVNQDDPRMDVRDESLALPGRSPRQPLRVIVDGSLAINEKARMLQQGRCLVAYVDGDPGKLERLQAAGVETVALAGIARDDKPRVDLHALLKHLASTGCNEVMVEAGSQLAGAFLQAQLLDALYVYMAPCLLGSTARPLVELPLSIMADKVNLTVNEVRQVGDDYRWHLVPEYRQ